MTLHLPISQLNYDPEMTPEEIVDYNEIKTLLAHCFNDFAMLAKIIFGEIFEDPFSEPHIEIIRKLNGNSRYIDIAAPRGIGKTTIARTLAARAILYRTSRFITYIGKSATYAEMQTENIKYELRTNELVRKLWGDIKDTPYDMNDQTFSKKAWVANGYTFILPRGAGQQIRGLNWLSYRPDLFIIDDLEDDELVQNEDQRDKLKIWFFAQVMKARPRTGKEFRFLYIDTIKHEDSLLTNLQTDRQWDSLKLSVCDSNYKTLMPTFMPQVELDEEVMLHQERGLMDVFAREMMSEPIDKKTAVFKPSYFKYYRETDREFQEILERGYVENALIIDPAKTTNMKSAESGLVVWSVDCLSNRLYQRVAIGEKFHPDELYDVAFMLAQQYNVVVIGLEVTSLNEFITQPFTNEMIRRGLHFEIEELKARSGTGEFAGPGGGKKARISSLQSYYRQGMVYHNADNCGKLETQLMSFPRSAKWDVMDAAAYIVELLEMGERYFYPKELYEIEGRGIEAEYDDLELEYDDDLGDDYAIV
jgi:hypothetical protein